MSSLGIFNKETKTYQKVAGTAEAAVVDAEMSDTSTNTVQNKVIKKYVDDKTDELKNADMVGKTTTFNENGNITETFTDGSEKVTVFNSDGSIVETLTDAKGKVTTKTTTFNADGSITEEVSA